MSELTLLVRIDLSNAELSQFERYENEVLKLLPKVGAELIARVRSLDASEEVHLLKFEDRESFEAYLNHPERGALQPLWDRSGATSNVNEVNNLS